MIQSNEHVYTTAILVLIFCCFVTFFLETPHHKCINMQRKKHYKNSTCAAGRSIINNFYHVTHYLFLR
ncbi:uncharacterized protein LOC144427154 isoform X2 [Styela clava]